METKTKIESGCYQYEVKGMLIRAERSGGKWNISAHSGSEWKQIFKADSLKQVDIAIKNWMAK